MSFKKVSCPAAPNTCNCIGTCLKLECMRCGVQAYENELSTHLCSHYYTHPSSPITIIDCNKDLNSNKNEDSPLESLPIAFGIYLDYLDELYKLL